MVGCCRSYCIFPNALVMQFYVAQSVTNIDFTSKTNNSWYKSPITTWKMPIERYDSYLSPKKKKQTHYPFIHIYFNGFLPHFNFLLHPWRIAYTDNILLNYDNLFLYSSYVIIFTRITIVVWDDNFMDLIIFLVCHKILHPGMKSS